MVRWRVSDAAGLKDNLNQDWRKKYDKPDTETYFTNSDASKLFDDEFATDEDFIVPNLAATLLSPPRTVSKAKALKLAEIYKGTGIADSRRPTLAQSASAAAKYTTFRQMQIDKKPFYLCGRPSTAKGLPAAITDQIFAKFLEDINKGEFSVEAAKCTAELVGVLSELPDDEDKLATQIRRILEQFLDLPEGQFETFQPWPDQKRIETDGTFYLRKGEIVIAFLWMEVKLGISSTSQDIAGKLLNYPQFHAQNFSQGERFCAPALGIEIMGECVRISSIYVSGEETDFRLVYEPLTDFITCLDFLSNQPERLDYLACVLSALQTAANGLLASHKAFLKHEEEGGDGNIDFTARFPYNIRNDSRYKSLHWRYNWTGKERKLVMEAQHEEFGEVILKYIRKPYPADLHRRLADAGLAPKLFQVEELSGNWSCVIMEHLHSKDGWSQCDLAGLAEEEVWPAVVNAIDDFHMMGLVHLDLRPCNLYVRKTNGVIEVKFIDLDSLGLAEQCKFPNYLNPEIPWPSGVKSGGVVTKELDKAIWTSTRSNRQRAWLPPQACLFPAPGRRAMFHQLAHPKFRSPRIVKGF